jgi:hypothetical protein
VLRAFVKDRRLTRSRRSGRSASSSSTCWRRTSSPAAATARRWSTSSSGQWHADTLPRAAPRRRGLPGPGGGDVLALGRHGGARRRRGNRSNAAEPPGLTALRPGDEWPCVAGRRAGEAGREPGLPNPYDVSGVHLGPAPDECAGEPGAVAAPAHPDRLQGLPPDPSALMAPRHAGRQTRPLAGAAPRRPAVPPTTTCPAGRGAAPRATGRARQLGGRGSEPRSHAVPHPPGGDGRPRGLGGPEPAVDRRARGARRDLRVHRLRGRRGRGHPPHELGTSSAGACRASAASAWWRSRAAARTRAGSTSS